jgi:NADPH:quinone reductase-like Zn-dependent oxidoreductase
VAKIRAMRAIVQRRYGSIDDLELGEIEPPVPAAGDVLVRVRAASVHPDVWHVVTGLPRVLRLMGAGVRRPKQPVPGTDMAGVVEQGGERFQPGDEVFGETVTGYSWRNGGAFAELVAVPERLLARKPPGVTFEQAAAVPTSGFIAHLAVRREGKVAPGQTVLVNGAGGGVGSIAVQLAKAAGATVTGVDAPAKLERVRSLGADRAIDFTTTDFTREGERYDVIVDIAANHSFQACRRALTPDGTYVLIDHGHYGRTGEHWLGSLPRVLLLVARSPFIKQLPAIDFSVPDKQAVMTELAELIEAGRLEPMVDRTFPLEETREALRYLASGQAAGKVVISVA